MTKKSVIIVAGGSGKRMGSDLPKQFIPIAGKPILMHTIKAFYHYDKTLKIIVVLPENQQEYWKRLINQHGFTIKHTLANGGAERFFSVKNGLDKVPNSSVVGIHDGVRPMVSQETIARCFNACTKGKAVIPVLPANESIRKIENNQSKAVNRSLYFMVQTPQVFDATLLKKAYQQNFNSTFTDDASVVEQLGKKITTVEGNPENIKITRPMDLKIAAALISK